jgi:hypothetical protein
MPKRINTDKLLIPTVSSFDESKIMGIYADKRKPTDADRDDEGGAFARSFRLATGNNNDPKRHKCPKGRWAPFNSQSTDMTLGVVDPNSENFVHNNMHRLGTSKRDFNTHDLEDTRILEAYTGNSDTRITKHEMKPLYAPMPDHMGEGNLGSTAMSKLIEERVVNVVGNKKNGSKPFEPRRVGPGISLDADTDYYVGGRDLSRVMPRTVDDMRRKDNPKDTMSFDPIAGSGGQGRGPVDKTLLHKRHSDMAINWAPRAGGGIAAQRARDNIDLSITNRTFTHPYAITPGRSIMPYSSKTSGKHRNSTKTIYKGEMSNPDGMNSRFNPNVEAIDTPVTRREQALIELMSGVGTNRGHMQYIANQTTKPKQERPLQSGGHAGRVTGVRAANYNEHYKGKQYMPVHDFVGAGTTRGNHAHNYANVPDKTIKDINTNIQRDGFMRAAEGRGAVGVNDVRARSNADIVNIQRSTFMGGPQRPITDQQNRVYRTQKEDLVNIVYTAAPGTTHAPGTNYSNIDLPVTLKQLSQVNNWMSGAGGSVTQPTSHDARHNVAQNVGKEETLERYEPTSVGFISHPTPDNIGELPEPYELMLQDYLPNAKLPERSYISSYNFS